MLLFAERWGFDARACAEPARQRPAWSRLAAEGSRFSWFYAASPLRPADRLAVLTGRFPLPTSGDAPIPAGPRLPDLLAESGYAAARAESAEEVVRVLRGTPAGGPLFLEIWPGTAPGEADRVAAVLLAELDARDLADRTLLAAVGAPRKESPEGCPAWSGSRTSLFERGVRRQLLVRWPGHVPAGRRDERTVLASVDLLPTLCGMAGVDPGGEHLDGEDLGEAWRGQPVDRERSLVWAAPGGPGSSEDDWPRLAIRRGEFKLLLDPEAPRVALFRLSDDPGEQVDLARSHAGVTEYLTATLLQWQRSWP